MRFLLRCLRKGPSPGPQDARVRLGFRRDKALYWGPHPGCPCLADILEMRFTGHLEPQLATAEASARCHCHCCLRAELGREQSGEVGAETLVKGVASPAKSQVKLAMSARGWILFPNSFQPSKPP